MPRKPYGPVSPFSNILDSARKIGLDPRENKSRDWFRKMAYQSKINGKQLMKSAGVDRLRNRITYGDMVMFYYDPKHKETLPYYDQFPLIFAFQDDGNSFLGINMHYLPPRLRAKLMDALYDTLTKPSLQPRAKLAITYNILKSASKFKLFKPCIKRYLKNHVRSRFFKVTPEEWDIALFLQTEQWQKANKGRVYADSRKMIK